MSASNWSTCPKCEILAEKAKAAAIQKADKQYGKVSAEKYIELRELANAKIELRNTLRENYELGVYEDEFSVVYRCLCQQCGFSFEFKHEQDVDLEAKERES